MQVLGTTCESNERWINRYEFEAVENKPDAEDIEAFWYENTLCLGIQGHPEYQGYPDYSDWCLQLIQDRIIENDRCKLQNNCLRLTPEMLKKRNKIFNYPKTVTEFVKEYS